MRCLLYTLAMLALTAPVASSAQGCSRTAPDADENASELSELFNDPEAAAERGPDIQLLAETDTAQVVRNE